MGGTDAAPGQIPYIASLRWLGLHHFCGASIIRKNFVLTAGHCMEGYVPEDVGVAVGALLLSDGGFLHQCTRIITHPNYTIYQVTSDVALVQVADPFVYNLEVQPIGISNQYIEGDVAARVSGWGMTHVKFLRTGLARKLKFVFCFNFSMRTINCQIICKPWRLKL